MSMFVGLWGNTRATSGFWLERPLRQSVSGSGRHELVLEGFAAASLPLRPLPETDWCKGLVFCVGWRWLALVFNLSDWEYFYVD